jgi:hypothetical protein
MPVLARVGYANVRTWQELRAACVKSRSEQHIAFTPLHLSVFASASRVVTLFPSFVCRSRRVGEVRQSKAP